MANRLRAKESELEARLQKGQSFALDQDRRVLELQKKFADSERVVGDLRKELRDLKHAHNTELIRLEASHKDKIKELRQMLDQYRVQMANLERLSKQNMDFIESARANAKTKKPAVQ